METLHRNKALYERMISVRPGNDNRPAHSRALSFGRSVFPEGAVARICRPGRSVTTSARTGSAWRLTFERHTAPFIEPLMGYTGRRDTLTQVELSFPTLESAIRYAERQGLTYIAQAPTRQIGNRRSPNVDEKPAQAGRSRHTFSDATIDRLGLAALQESYGRPRWRGQPQRSLRPGKLDTLFGEAGVESGRTASRLEDDKAAIRHRRIRSHRTDPCTSLLRQQFP